VAVDSGRAGQCATMGSSSLREGPEVDAVPHLVHQHPLPRGRRRPRQRGGPPRQAGRGHHAALPVQRRQGVPRPAAGSTPPAYVSVLMLPVYETQARLPSLTEPPGLQAAGQFQRWHMHRLVGQVASGAAALILTEAAGRQRCRGPTPRDAVGHVPAAVPGDAAARQVTGRCWAGRV